MAPFANALLSWYADNKRDLPWRQKPTPYHVLVSEFMLQQTQVSRVIIKYYEFLATFPTIQDLAGASKAEVMVAWSGLGYNRRALLLHRFAQEVVQKYQGAIPQAKEQLAQLPGIGPYTTGSILSFAHNLPEPAIDVNVRRIYLRFFQGKDQGLPMGKKEEQELYKLIKSTIPENKSSELHNALMDFGSLVCLRDAPCCTTCPLQQSCKFYPLYQNNRQQALFVAQKRQEQGQHEGSKFVPNRIFRGRIVEFVRKNRGKHITVDELGRSIKKDYRSKERQWLLSLLEKLEHEGMIKHTQEGAACRLDLSS